MRHLRRVLYPCCPTLRVVSRLYSIMSRRREADYIMDTDLPANFMAALDIGCAKNSHICEHFQMNCLDQRHALSTLIVIIEM